MAQPRFATAKDLFEAFPTAQYHVGAKPTDQPIVEFIRALVAAGQHRDAISYCAFLLPRREAVWWACQCARATGKPNAEDETLLQVAENWVREPEEPRRLEALRIGATGDVDSAARSACRAAAESGGIMEATPKWTIRAAPDATARGVRGAVLIAATKVGSKDKKSAMAKFVDDALRLLQRDSAKD